MPPRPAPQRSPPTPRTTPATMRSRGSRPRARSWPFAMARRRLPTRRRPVRQPTGRTPTISTPWRPLMPSRVTSTRRRSGRAWPSSWRPRPRSRSSPRASTCTAAGRAFREDPKALPAGQDAPPSATAYRSIEECAAAIARHPDDVHAYCRRGQLYYERKAYDEAIADYTRAIELEPTRAVHLRGRAIIRREQGRLDLRLAGLFGRLEAPRRRARSSWRSAPRSTGPGGTRGRPTPTRPRSTCSAR